MVDVIASLWAKAGAATAMVGIIAARDLGKSIFMAILEAFTSVRPAALCVNAAVKVAMHNKISDFKLNKPAILIFSVMILIGDFKVILMIVMVGVVRCVVASCRC